MGILGLTKLVRKKTKMAIRNLSLDELEGKTLAIDISIWINQFCTTTAINGEECIDSVITGILSRLECMFRYSITPLCVFDGSPPMEKGEEIRRRKETKVNLKAKAELTEDGEGRERLLRQSIRPSRELIHKLKDALVACNIPVRTAPSEAEAECAKLCERNHAWGVISEDMDSLTFGASRLIRNFSNLAILENRIELIDLEILLKEMELTQTQFIDLCILCGCDYTGKVKGIGPVNAYKLIAEHKSIEGIKSRKPEGDFSQCDYETSRVLFSRPLISEKEIEFPNGKFTNVYSRKRKSFCFA